jgi:hypothetical protein
MRKFAEPARLPDNYPLSQGMRASFTVMFSQDMRASLARPRDVACAGPGCALASR